MADGQKDLSQLQFRLSIPDLACGATDSHGIPLLRKAHSLSCVELLARLEEQLSQTHEYLRAVESSFERYSQQFVQQQQIVDARTSQLPLLRLTIASRRRSSSFTHTYTKQASEIAAEAKEMEDERVAFETIESWKFYLILWIEELERLEMHLTKILQWYTRRMGQKRALSIRCDRISDFEEVATLLQQMKMIELRVDLIRGSAENEAGKLLA